MSVGWFVAPYNQKALTGYRARFRYCAMQDFDAAIRSDNGDWCEGEILGNSAIVKVRASLVTLSDIASTGGFSRLPGTDLNERLTALTTVQERQLQDLAGSLGYSGVEIDRSLGTDVRGKTLREYLTFLSTRRVRPRWDSPTQQIVFDQEIVPCRNLNDIDRNVSAGPPGYIHVATQLWIAFLSSLYFGTGFRPSRSAIQYFAHEAARLGLSIQEHSYDFLEWVAGHSSMLLFRLFGAFPTTSVLDAFTGVDGTDLPVYSANWTNLDSGYNPMEIQSNAATATIDSTDNGAAWVGNVGADTEVFVTFGTSSTVGGLIAILVRLNDVNTGTNYQFDGYGLEVLEGATDSVQHYTITNAVWTVIGSAISQEFADGDALGLEATGANPTSLQAYRKPSGGSWAALDTARTNSDWDGVGRIGLYTSDTVARLDDFGGGTVVAGGATLETLPATEGAGADRSRFVKAYRQLT